MKHHLAMQAAAITVAIMICVLFAVVLILIFARWFGPSGFIAIGFGTSAAIFTWALYQYVLGGLKRREERRDLGVVNNGEKP